MRTTHKELAWLSSHIAEYREVQATPSQQIKSWLRTTIVPKFLEAFLDHPTREVGDLIKVRDLMLLGS